MGYNTKNRYGLTRDMEKQAGKVFGKYVSKEKAIVLYVVTTIVCLMPILSGIRLWDQIPEIVETGIIGSNGEDDSLPRAVLVYGIPGLMAVLDLICHTQLYLNQKLERLAPQASRIVGRWGFPILSAVFASGCMYSAAGLEFFSSGFIVPCILSLILLLLGSHFFDCKRDSSVAFNFSFLKYNDPVWIIAHRFAGICYMVAGLIILFFISLEGVLPLGVAAVAVLLMVAPVPVGKVLSDRSRKNNG